MMISSSPELAERHVWCLSVGKSGRLESRVGWKVGAPSALRALRGGVRGASWGGGAAQAALRSA